MHWQGHLFALLGNLQHFSLFLGPWYLLPLADEVKVFLFCVLEFCNFQIFGGHPSWQDTDTSGKPHWDFETMPLWLVDFFF